MSICCVCWIVQVKKKLLIKFIWFGPRSLSLFFFNFTLYWWQWMWIWAIRHTTTVSLSFPFLFLWCVLEWNRCICSHKFIVFFPFFFFSSFSQIHLSSQVLNYVLVHISICEMRIVHELCTYGVRRAAFEIPFNFISMKTSVFSHPIQRMRYRKNWLNHIWCEFDLLWQSNSWIDQFNCGTKFYLFKRIF